MTRAAFLDRDGVINLDRGYVHRWEDFVFLPGVIDAMASLRDAGFKLVVVTNQSGIARGYFSELQYHELTQRMLTAFADRGVHIDGVYHCPHHPAGNVPEFAIECDCRKPAPGLILRAAGELGISLADSILIGDKSSDIIAARAAGVGRAFAVRSTNAESNWVSVVPAEIFDSLLDCVKAIFVSNRSSLSNEASANKQN